MAWDDWHKTLDQNLETNRDLFSNVGFKSKFDNISMSLSEENVAELKMECRNNLENGKLNSGCFIEERYRPTGLVLNSKALINLSNVSIPEDIKFAISFGYKFLFPYVVNDDNIHEILAQMELTIQQSIPEAKQIETCLDVRRILRGRRIIQYDNNKRWLIFVGGRTMEFFKNNDSLLAIKSDKGGHSVIMDKSDYISKIETLLNCSDYSIVNDVALERLIDREEQLLVALKQNVAVKPCFDGMPLFEPKTLWFPKFYGLVKIHKDGYPLRPITATIGSVGYLLAKIFGVMLDRVFPRTDFHIKDSYDFVKFANNVKINSSDILISFDVVSMFTSIPLDLVKRIIFKHLDEFRHTFDIDGCLINEILEFLLRECTYFIANDKIYKQNDGLPMGSCISPILARITMDEVIASLLDSCPRISFIKAYVDDTIAAMSADLVDLALSSLNDCS